MIVGAGPAGAACAMSLARLGFIVDVIEARLCCILRPDTDARCAECAHLACSCHASAVDQES